MILARGFSREREIAVRLSVGATRPRLVRQLLTESLMLASLGTAAALGVGFVAARLILTGSDTPAFMQPKLDLRVTIFALAMAVLASVLFGLMPALQAVKPRSTRTRARGVLVAAQVAAGCTLLVVSTLLTRALDRVTHAPLGFEYEHHLTLDPDLNANGFNAAAARVYWATLRDRLAGVPGVRGLSLETLPPLGNRSATARIGKGYTAFVHHVDPDYFRVMGIPLRRGRNIRADETGAAMVSESFARAMWPGEDPLGKVWDEATVVGIVGNAATVSLANPEASEFYHPIDDEHMPRAVMIVRVDGDPSSMTAVLVGAARSIEPRVSVSAGVLRRGLRGQAAAAAAHDDDCLGARRTGAGAGGRRARRPRGLHGLSARTRDWHPHGARRAAQGRDRRRPPPVPHTDRIRPCRRLFAAAVLSRVLQKELFGLSPFDPVSYLAAAALFTIVAALATAGPLRRALKVDPIAALKCE